MLAPLLPQCRPRLYSTAIVGSGPSAFYLAKSLLLSPSPPSSVSLFDASPAPFGLIRDGVAPDHQDVKNAANDYTRIFAAHPQLSFYGNVPVGTASSPGALPLSELREFFDVVALASGCQADRSLPLPVLGPAGAPLPGANPPAQVLTSRELVGFYNGRAGASPALPAAPGGRPLRAVVIGAGNVSLDASRVLLKAHLGQLGATDAPSGAVEKLAAIAEGGVEVAVVARRGVGQVKFGIKELREIFKASPGSYAFSLPPEELERSMNAATLAEIEGVRPKERLQKLLRTISSSPPPTPPPASSLSVRTLLSPAAYLADARGALRGVRFRPQVLSGPAGSQACADDPAAAPVDVACDLAVLSLGYVSTPLRGLERRHKGGRYEHEAGKVKGEEGVYLAGWVKRGAEGIVGTNIACAKETARSIVEDFGGKGGGAGEAEVREWLGGLGVEFTDWGGWERVDEVERDPARKRCEEQPREKVVDERELLEIARGAA
ncbi:hypothetical protein TeGR_g14985 [Tetraparma gracilis]|uniref:NADPH:adrenodoxin oxidoreductase, mitochondrial n=1 Tax=Tetraparma gracilis TaxID=2962635 RepID=A0ABQ6N6Z4_9STRA|nr:hypothetical protein TeGR_g14985 [Tetraparma gracilis]